ncbi:MAG: hypothetical protein M3389_09225 [Actinomycetota bacterium]|nr:hypothetical protein [Actinomycetota bacterium]
MASKRDNDSGGGLSLQTLIIASLSSLAAALFIHEFWQGGAILGAAVTPVIVAIVSELLRKPADVLSTRRTAVNPPPVVTEEEDRFGIWEEQRKARPRRRLHIGLAVATGLVAFAIAAFFLTGAELVFGGASDSDRFRVLPGKQERSDRERERDAPATTQPGEAAPAPDEEQEAPPTVTVTTPAETTPPEDEPPAEEPPPETAPVQPPETLP